MSEWQLALAIVTGLLALTRAVRLVVDDDFPPVKKLREELALRLPTTWAKVVECPWCVAPYLAAPATVWFALLVQFPTWTVNNWLWWGVNGWAAASWVAAFATLRDQPPDSR